MFFRHVGRFIGSPRIKIMSCHVEKHADFVRKLPSIGTYENPFPE